MLFLSTILHWQPLFIVLAIRKMLYQNRIRLSISKTNKYLTILNLLFIIFMLCVALLLKQEAHTIFYIITISGIYFAVALLYADFLFKIVDKKLISQTQIILYIFVGLVVLEIVVRQGFFANIAPANDRRSEFFLGIIPFYSERIIVGGSGAAGYTIILMIFGVISSGIFNYKIRWSNFFIIGLLLYLSGSRTAMIVVPATISYFLILRVTKNTMASFFCITNFSY